MERLRGAEEQKLEVIVIFWARERESPFDSRPMFLGMRGRPRQPHLPLFGPSVISHSLSMSLDSLVERWKEAGSIDKVSVLELDTPLCN
jgi:hypothetical protein